MLIVSCRVPSVSAFVVNHFLVLLWIFGLSVLSVLLTMYRTSRSFVRHSAILCHFLLKWKDVRWNFGGPLLSDCGLFCSLLFNLSAPENI